MAFGWTDLMVRIPFFGLIAKNSKNFVKSKNDWMNAEEKLCGAYKPYVSQLQKEKFMQRIEYMKHAGDLGRTPISMGLKIFLFFLVAAEAMGFSYILGTWAASDGSANLYNYLMVGIVVVLASILAIVTHNAGEQFYRTSLIRSCIARYKSSGEKSFHSTQSISLSDDQYLDKNDQAHTRCLNRITKGPTDQGSYAWSVVALAFVALIFFGSSTMRYAHMETEMSRQSQATETANSNPFGAAAAMPSELTAPQKESDRKAQSEQSKSTTVEGLSAIMILGFIFIVTQIVGFGSGHKHSFAGAETYKKASGKNSFWFWSDMDGAYADTWGYSTYDAYWEAMQPVKDVVNGRLKDLQHILQTNSPVNLTLDKTFDDYLKEQSGIAKEGQDAHNSLPEKTREITKTIAQVLPVVAVVPVSYGSLGIPVNTTLSPLDQAKVDMNLIKDKEQQQLFFKSLSPDLRESLKPWLKQRKEESVKEVSQDELNELF